MQISEWEAMDMLDPIGKWRDEYMMAYLISSITNIAISAFGKKGTKLTSVQDFMPKWGEVEGEEKEVPQQSVETMKAILYSIAKGQGVRKKPKPKPKGVSQVNK